MPSNRKQARTRQPSASAHTLRTLPHTHTHTHSDTCGVRGRRVPGCSLQAGTSFRSGAGSPGSSSAFLGPGKRGGLQGPGSSSLCRSRGSQKRLPRQGVAGSTRAPRRPHLGVAAGRLPDNFPPSLALCLHPCRVRAAHQTHAHSTPGSARILLYKRLYSYLPSIFFSPLYIFPPPHVIFTLILDLFAMTTDQSVFSLFSAIKISKAFSALS